MDEIRHKLRKTNIIIIGSSLILVAAILFLLSLIL